MQGGFSVALLGEDTITCSKLFRDIVVRGHKDCIFFMSSRGKPVVYSTIKNVWSYVSLLSEMQHIVPIGQDDHYLHSGALDSVSVEMKMFQSRRSRNALSSAASGRPPGCRKCHCRQELAL